MRAEEKWIERKKERPDQPQGHWAWLTAQSHTVHSAFMPGRTGALNRITSPGQGSLIWVSSLGTG